MGSGNLWPCGPLPCCAASCGSCIFKLPECCACCIQLEKTKSLCLWHLYNEHCLTDWLLPSSSFQASLVIFLSSPWCCHTHTLIAAPSHQLPCHPYYHSSPPSRLSVLSTQPIPHALLCPLSPSKSPGCMQNLKICALLSPKLKQPYIPF